MVSHPLDLNHDIGLFEFVEIALALEKTIEERNWSRMQNVSMVCFPGVMSLYLRISTIIALAVSDVQIFTQPGIQEVPISRYCQFATPIFNLSPHVTYRTTHSVAVSPC